MKGITQEEALVLAIANGDVEPSSSNTNYLNGSINALLQRGLLTPTNPEKKEGFVCYTLAVTNPGRMMLALYKQGFR